MAKKSEIVWGIRQNGLLLPFLTRSTRRKAIEDASGYVWASWAELRRRGFTVHKLEVRNAR